MSFKRCPGSMSFTQPKIELVRCPHCGADAEVWSDEADGKCSQCGRTVCRTTTQSCIDWCKYARECLGENEHKRYQEMKIRLRKESLLQAAEPRLPDDAARQRARCRIEYAEQLLSHSNGADPTVVIAATAFLETGDSAQEILHQLGYPEGFIKEVSGIISTQDNPPPHESLNGRVVRKAALMVAEAHP